EQLLTGTPIQESGFMAAIAITRTAHPNQPPPDDSLRFGNVFSDHMFVMDYHEGRGWHDLRIIPYQPFSIDPATCVLHYGQAVFDGLKAFRGADGVIRLFRAPDHAARLGRSSERLCIPAIAPELVLQSL